MIFQGEEKTMAESILGVSNITLFGRVVDDIAVSAKTSKKKFARIYGFSHAGVYYDMMTPTLFLVEGTGVDADKVKEPGPDSDDKPFYEDLKAWTCSETDATVRLEYEAGRFEQVLLGLIGDDSFGDVSGSRVSGSRVAGSRVAGSRVAGSRVSGSRVSGSRVSGSRVSGSRVSGSRVDGD